MKVTKNVRSTNPNLQELEVNIDTVYKRINITEVINEDGNIEFNIGEEHQYTLREYIESLLETDVGQTIIAENTTEVMETVTLITEMQNMAHAQSNAEMLELVMMMGGGL